MKCVFFFFGGKKSNAVFTAIFFFTPNLKKYPNHIYIYIYRGWLICFHKHLGRSATNLFLIFQNPNSRSEPFILFSILISAWRPNFTFFGFFLLFIKPL